MEAVDGNAIAGQLYEHFGAEMTEVRGTCAHCGAVSPVAELAVYDRAPGAVARCRTCGSVLMVLVEVANTTRVTLTGFQLDLTAGP